MHRRLQIHFVGRVVERGGYYRQKRTSGNCVRLIGLVNFILSNLLFIQGRAVEAQELALTYMNK